MARRLSMAKKNVKARKRYRMNHSYVPHSEKGVRISQAAYNIANFIWDARKKQGLTVYLRPVDVRHHAELVGARSPMTDMVVMAYQEKLARLH